MWIGAPCRHAVLTNPRPYLLSAKRGVKSGAFANFTLSTINKYIMGNIISRAAGLILPTVMSQTGTVIKGLGTVHGIVTPFIARVASKGFFFALFG